MKRTGTVVSRSTPPSQDYEWTPKAEEIEAAPPGSGFAKMTRFRAFSIHDCTLAQVSIGICVLALEPSAHRIFNRPAIRRPVKFMS
jgi:hypothetical protein